MGIELLGTLRQSHVLVGLMRVKRINIPNQVDDEADGAPKAAMTPLGGMMARWQRCSTRQRVLARRPAAWKHAVHILMISIESVQEVENARFQGS